MRLCACSTTTTGGGICKTFGWIVCLCSLCTMFCATVDVYYLWPPCVRSAAHVRAPAYGFLGRSEPRSLNHIYSYTRMYECSYECVFRELDCIVRRLSFGFFFVVLRCVAEPCSRSVAYRTIDVSKATPICVVRIHRKRLWFARIV